MWLLCGDIEHDEYMHFTNGDVCFCSFGLSSIVKWDLSSAVFFLGIVGIYSQYRWIEYRRYDKTHGFPIQTYQDIYL